MNDLAVLLLGEIKYWSLFGLNNLRYFRQSKDVAFVVRIWNWFASVDINTPTSNQWSNGIGSE